MIIINPASLIGRGAHRECYRHPGDDRLCIKINVSGDPRQCRRELEYYQHLQRRGIAWDMIPRYHGKIQTNLGPGAVFDVVMNHDGSVARDLEYYVASHELTAAQYGNISRALGALKAYLLRHSILTMRLHPKNIKCQESARGIERLYLVDNIGTSDYVPIGRYVRFLARMKLNRKWRRFTAAMLRAHPDNQALRRMLAPGAVQADACAGPLPHVVHAAPARLACAEVLTSQNSSCTIHTDK